MSNHTKTVAFIATGDEITDGDVLNTTGPEMARAVVERGLNVKQHLMVPDNEAAITEAITSTLQKCDVLIITGGLGPTSDDITRNALAKALQKQLVYDETSWQHIAERLDKINLPVGEHNRQQAYFPQGAIVLTNHHGTANGCFIEHEHKLIFMLPGPPHECLPLFRDHVLARMPNQAQHKLHWLLMGASEGDIAAQLDSALKHLSCRTGYRAVYPYLEFKIWADDQSSLDACEKIVYPLLENFLVSKENIPASTLLRQRLENGELSLRIHDQATGGLLQSTLLNPKTAAQISFVAADEADIVVSGLAEYWQNVPPPAETNLKIEFKNTNKSASRKIYYRGNIVRQYAVEWVCWMILKLI